MLISITAQGIEIKTGDIAINATPVGNRTETTITQETETIEGLRINSFALVALLLSLYLMYFSLGEIIGHKYGFSTTK